MQGFLMHALVTKYVTIQTFNKWQNPDESCRWWSSTAGRCYLPASTLSLFSHLLQAKTQEAFISEQLHSWSLTCILITVSLHQSQVSKHVFERLKKTLQESSSACSVHVGATSLMCLRLKVTQWPKRSCAACSLQGGHVSNVCML